MFTYRDSSEPVFPSGKALQAGKQSDLTVRIRFGSPSSSKVVVCGHCPVTVHHLLLTHEMALIAAHLNAGIILVVTM